MTIKFLHTADLHLGAPLESLGARVDADTAQRVRQLARLAFDDLVDTAITERVAFVVIAGDVYDHADREVGAQLRFQRCLERLHAAAIPVFITHGNHDPVVTSYRPARPLPPNVVVFPPGDVTSHIVECGDGNDGGTAIRIAGVSFAKQHERDNLAARFGNLGHHDGPTIAVLHANVAGNAEHDPYAPCTVADLVAAPVDYWALGHIHTRSVNLISPGRWWAYPGNLQGRSTKPAECGPKGALIVPIEHGQIGPPQFMQCDAVRFERLDVDVTGHVHIGDVIASIGREATARSNDAGNRPILARVRLTGSAEVHETLTIHRDQLLDLVRDDLGATVGDGAFLQIEVATRLPLDRAELLARRDITAAVLTELDDLRHRSVDDMMTSLNNLAGGLDRSTLRLIRDGFSRDADLAIRLTEYIERMLLDVLEGGPG